MMPCPNPSDPTTTALAPVLPQPRPPLPTAESPGTSTTDESGEREVLILDAHTLEVLAEDVVCRHAARLDRR